MTVQVGTLLLMRSGDRRLYKKGGVKGKMMKYCMTKFTAVFQSGHLSPGVLAGILFYRVSTLKGSGFFMG